MSERPSREKRPSVPGGAGRVLMSLRLGTEKISRPPLKFSSVSVTASVVPSLLKLKSAALRSSISGVRRCASQNAQDVAFAAGRQPASVGAERQ